MNQNTTLPLIDPVVVVDKNTSGVPGAIATTTPQPTTSAVTSLQSATTNNHQPIIVPKVPSPPKASSPSVIKNVTNTVKKATH